MSTSQFRFRAKSCLLTYSQTTEPQQDAFLHRAENHFNYVADALRTPRVYRLGRERHNDGGTHFHVFISWSERVSFRNQSLLDFHGSHPNIKPIPRTPEHAFDYAGKDGDIIYECGERPGKSGTLSSGRDSIWADALSQQCKEDFLSVLRNRAPRDFVLYFSAIKNYAAYHFASEAPEYHPPEFDTIQCEEFDRFNEWLSQSGIGGRERPPGRVMSLCLWGPSRLGKTVLARSLGKLCVGFAHTRN